VVHTKNKTLILTNMKKNPANVAIAFLIVIQILFLAGLQSCDGLKRDGDLSNVIKFEFVDPLEKVLVEASYFPPKEAISEVVRGENATLQFVVRSQYSITGLKVNVSQAMDGEKSLPPAKTGFVGYVRVGRSIFDYSRDRIVSESGYYPDPVLEQESVDVGFGNTQPIWISIPIPANAEKGLYKGKVTVSGKIGKLTFSMTKDYSVKVYPVTVEKTSLWVTNWFSIDTAELKWMNGGRSFVPFSEQHWEYIRTLAGKMAEYRQNVAIISPLVLSEFTFENGKWKTDFSRFDKAVDIFIKEGVIGRIEGGHIGGRAGSWTSQFVVMVPNKDNDPQKRFDNLPISDPGAQEFYRDFIVDLRNHIKDKGWDKIYMQHIADEPIPENVKSYIEIARYVRKLAPDFRFIDACHSKDLGGMLDIWVPQLDYMNRDYEFYKKQHQSGKEIWTYTCLNPKFEYANRFIELPLLRTRYIHWINYKYDIPGYLHWGLNYWSLGDPFAEQSGMQGEGGILPGGDSWIIYPRDGRLFSSIRFDAMRDGIVDYELFRMLEKKDPAMAKDIVDKVIFAFDKYDNNVGAFRMHRRHLMEVLSE
jgi:hypothetical protein